MSIVKSALQIKLNWTELNWIDNKCMVSGQKALHWQKWLLNMEDWYTMISYTLFPSSQRVTMTIIEVFCSQIIIQKSPTVSSLGPWRKKREKKL